MELAMPSVESKQAVCGGLSVVVFGCFFVPVSFASLGARELCV